MTETNTGNLSITGNLPNPWSDYTLIRYNLTQDDQVRINMYDSSGKLVFEKQMQASKGVNEIRIDREDINASGVLFYDLITSKEKVQGKMILIK